MAPSHAIVDLRGYSRNRPNRKPGSGSNRSRFGCVRRLYCPNRGIEQVRGLAMKVEAFTAMDGRASRRPTIPPIDSELRTRSWPRVTRFCDANAERARARTTPPGAEKQGSRK